MLKKTISVTVTDTQGNSVTSDATEIVSGFATLDEVKLDNTTPKVGDELTATAYDKDGQDISGDVTWQWYRVTDEGNVVKIANATKRSYLVREIDAAGAVLYCVAKDGFGNEFTSDEASIIAGSNVTSIAINGMSSKLSLSKINDVPVIGDELEVALEGAGQSLSYQWYRSGSKIVGADKPVYEVVQDDQKQNLAVEITIPDVAPYTFDEHCFSNAGKVGTNIDGTGAITTGVTKHVYLYFTNKVAEDLNKSEITMNTTPKLGSTITAKVAVDKNKNGNNTDSGDVLNKDDASWSWYRDEVAPENKIAQSVVPTTLSDKWEEGQSYSVDEMDLGHKVIAVVSAKDDQGYTKSIQKETDIIYAEVGTVEISAKSTAYIDRDNANIGEELTASAKTSNAKSIDKKNLIFTWSRDGEEIASGTGMDTYILNEDDVTALGEAARKYTVSVEGIGNYVGTADSAEVELARNANAGLYNGEIFIGIKNSTTGQWMDNTPIVNANGDTLELVTKPADAINHLDISWTYLDGTTATTVKTAGSKLTINNSLGTKVQAIVALKTDSKYKTHAEANNGGTGGQATIVAKVAEATNAEPDWAGVANAEDGTHGTSDLIQAIAAAAEASATDAAKSPTLGRGIGEISYTITNGRDGSDKKTYTTPEVGRYIEVSLSEDDGNAKVAFSRNEDSTVLVVAGTVWKYRIHPQDIGQKIKIAVTNTTLNTNKSTTTDAVVKSSRQLKEVKIFDAGDTLASPSKALFDKKTNASVLNNNVATFPIYVLDNEGYIVVRNATEDNDKSLTYPALYKDNQYFLKAATAALDTDNDDYTEIDGTKLTVGDRITVEVYPDGLMFTGDSVSYTFSGGVAE